ncbi:hypothetical protein HNP84_003900 [Thermocatellispora tengchongensis]|uniref:Uncharacterized protein n=1 Tax=Thermocatellispora tengchongensis TaxID=1073253 RepID=A0A840NZ40_9ACTN|nr:hypothetical protein [Thermocatellispora tengchongensis]MBB5134174.1 hypothetical protein [Thermocatellispora tengchongensis]
MARHDRQGAREFADRREAVAGRSVRRRNTREAMKNDRWHTSAEPGGV